MDAAFQPELPVDAHSEAPSKMLELIPDPCALQTEMLADVLEGDFVFPQCGKVPLCRVGNRTVIVILHVHRPTTAGGLPLVDAAHCAEDFA